MANAPWEVVSPVAPSTAAGSWWRTQPSTPVLNAQPWHALHMRVPRLQVKPQEVPLQLAVLLAGCAHGVHDVVPQLAVLLFATHALPHL